MVMKRKFEIVFGRRKEVAWRREEEGERGDVFAPEGEGAVTREGIGRGEEVGGGDGGGNSGMGGKDRWDLGSHGGKDLGVRRAG